MQYTKYYKLYDFGCHSYRYSCVMYIGFIKLLNFKN